MDRDRLDRNEGDGEEGRSGSARWEHRGNHRPSHDSTHHPPPRIARTWDSNHHDNHDNLPEWYTREILSTRIPVSFFIRLHFISLFNVTWSF